MIALVAAMSSPAPAGALEPGCRKPQARAVVKGFVEAFSRGDVDYLDQLWAAEPDFFWYSVNTDATRRGVLAEDRSTLPAYFHERSSLGDALRIRKLTVDWEADWHGAWGIDFVVRRTSDEPGATGVYSGTGAVTCNRMIAWAMAKQSG